VSRRYPSPPRPYFKAGNNPRFSDFKVPFKDIKAQNLGEGVSAPTADTCEDCGQWDSELKYGSCSNCHVKEARFRKGVCGECKEQAKPVGGYCADCLTPDARIKRAKRAIKAGEAIGLVYVEDMGKVGTHKGKLK
jgi:hypothetical protein